MILSKVRFCWVSILVLWTTCLISCSQTQSSEKPNSSDQLKGNTATSNANSRENYKERVQDDLRQELREMADDFDIEARKVALSTLRTSKLFNDDDFEIRIWVGFDLEPIRALIIEKRKAKWHAFYLKVKDKESGQRKRIVSVKPHGGWEKLWKSFQEYEIETLRSEFEIENVDPYEDSGYVFVEVLNRAGYRYYGYLPPCNPTNSETKKLANILKVIRNEFGIKLTNCEAIVIDF